MSPPVSGRRLTKVFAETGAHANNVTRLIGSTACCLQIGDFRVLFEESDTDVIVTKIAPRGNVYD